MIAARTAAEELRVARLAGVPRAPFTDTDPALDERWGYQVQDEDRAQRLSQGERVVGAKLGLTSRAKQVTMGVHQPIVGFLTDAMHLPNGHDTDLFSRTAQPRIEPEIAFRLGGVVGRPVHTATGAAVLGHPLLALVQLSEHLAKRGERLPVGAIVLAGALTDAVPIRPGVLYRAEIDRLGPVGFSVSTP